MIVGILIYLIFFFLNNDEEEKIDLDVVAEVGDEKIYLSEYKKTYAAVTRNDTGDGSSDVLKEKVLDEIINVKILDKELAKRNISISEEELEKKAKELFNEYDDSSISLKSYFRDFAKIILARDKLSDEILTWREGYVLYCNFDRVFQFDMENKDKTVTEKKYKADKAYAGKLCKGVKTRLESGKSDFKKELAKIKSDPVIGDKAWEPYSMGFGLSFDKDTYSERIFSIGYSDFEMISALDVSGGDNYYLLTLKQETPEKEEVAFAVVYLKGSINKGEASSYSEWLIKKQNEYGVNKYLERIKL